MATKRLTKATVEALKPGNRPFVVWDNGAGAVAGFGVKVLLTGRKVFVFQYRLKGAGRAGKARRFTIGTYGPGLTFSHAKDIAEQLRASVVSGGDPVHDTKAKALAAVERDRLSKEHTFKALADLWLKRKAKFRTYIQMKKMIDVQLAPLHSLDVASITQAELERVVVKVEERAPFMAVRVLLELRSILEFGVNRRWLGENLAKHLEVQIDGPPGGRDRVLSNEELIAIWKAANKDGWPFGDVVKLLILTGQRRTEVSDLRAPELDVDAGVWRLPAERAKNKEPHLVHLSPQAVTVVRHALKRKPVGNLLFTTTGTTRVKGFAKFKERLDQVSGVKKWRLHDIRRTVATRLQEMGIGIAVVERILNHRSATRSGIIGVYQRAEFLPERKAALEAWGVQIETLVEGRTPADNVVPMQRGAGG